MYTSSDCDVFIVGEKSFEQMCDESTYDHFWVIGDNVTIIRELMRIQRNLPREIRLFRDAGTNTVAGALMNKNTKELILDQHSFSDSTFKGSYITYIDQTPPLDIVVIGRNKTLPIDELENKIITLDSPNDLKEAIDIGEINTDHFFYIEKGFKISNYFSFDARITNVIDCHYSYYGEYEDDVTTEHSIKILSKNIIKQVPSNSLLRYEGYLPLQSFSGTKVN